MSERLFIYLQIKFSFSYRHFFESSIRLFTTRTKRKYQIAYNRNEQATTFILFQKLNHILIDCENFTIEKYHLPAIINNSIDQAGKNPFNSLLGSYCMELSSFAFWLAWPTEQPIRFKIITSEVPNCSSILSMTLLYIEI